ncbi:MAG TPA: heavy metal translocating P-type ATPase [Polyangiaceae bacterium]|nr:heavy metal translocating P-type ATPase [Polyangiaceae bacterium]
MLHTESFAPTPAALAQPALVPPIECRHCGSPVPGMLLEPGAEQQFCCAGCRSVFQMLHAHELESYYQQPRGDADAPQPALTTGRDYTELNDPAFLDSFSSTNGAERSAELLLEGVHCAACVWLVEKLPGLVPGVTSCRLDYARRVAHVSWAEHSPELPARIAQTLDRLGYPPHPYRSGSRAEIERREDRALLLRVAVAGACAGNSMLFALALYAGAFSDMDPALLGYFRIWSVLVALPAVLWSAQVFYRGAWAALRTRSAHMDLPLSLGIVLAALSGTLNVARGHGDIYFDSLTMLIFVLLSARYLQGAQQRRAEQRAGSAQALTPHTARRIAEGGAVQVVPAESVPEGAQIEVLAGEVIPVDGQVVAGQSAVDRGWLTGESQPEAVSPGSSVLAGTTNLAARLVVRSEQSGSATRAARILREVEHAALHRAPIALLADRVSAYFLVGVLGASLLAFLIWLPAGIATAFETAIALLVVTCPCGLALATPLAVSSALAQAARAGLLIKGGASLEALARPGWIAFDKTGTLTEGQLSLTEWIGDESVQPLVKSLEAQSAHPIARALVQALAGVEALAVVDFEQRQGVGVSGLVAGQRVSVSAPHAVPVPLPEWAHNAVERLSRAAQTPSVVCVAGEVRAVLGLGDPIRPDAVATLLRLRGLGHRLGILSGDRQQVVDALVERLEQAAGSRLFELWRGEQSPEQKLAWVEQTRARGNVFMVGDGVNDAGALAAASVGIAVHGGAEASLQAAHVFAARSGVLPVLELVEGARRALDVIRTNLAFSLVYNLLAVGLTLSGHITPIWAAIIMPASSLSVVAHSYRRRMFRSGS